MSIDYKGSDGRELHVGGVVGSIGIIVIGGVAYYTARSLKDVGLKISEREDLPMVIEKFGGALARIPIAGFRERNERKHVEGTDTNVIRYFPREDENDTGSNQK